MLKVHNLDIRTNQPLIQNVSLELDNAEIVGIAAANGTGKSTLFKTIAGLRKEPTGEGGIGSAGGWLSFHQGKRAIFYFESTQWFDTSLRGGDYLELITGMWASDPSLIDEAIRYWEMATYIQKPIKSYSLGMKQKLLLSLYLVSGADFWILDEPTLALDQASVTKLKSYLLQGKQQGKGIIFSAHESETFFAICDRVLKIQAGSLLPREEGEI